MSKKYHSEASPAIILIQQLIHGAMRNILSHLALQSNTTGTVHCTEYLSLIEWNENNVQRATPKRGALPMFQQDFKKNETEVRRTLLLAEKL
jgi:hypothetical protein